MGTSEREGREAFVGVWALLDLLASALTMALWIDKSYYHGVRGWELVAEYVCAGLYALDLLLRLVQRGFAPAAPLAKEVWLDVFTAVPLLLQGSVLRSWLSVTYLRSLGVLWAYERLLEQQGRLGGMMLGSDLARRVATTAVRLAVVVCCFAGSMFLLEYLGDVPHLRDAAVFSEMGDISFHQMCYFIVVTIATIGYGDYSPKTLLGRTLLLVIVLGGVAFFTYEVNRLVSMRALQASGRGSFHPARRGGAHVLVCGGAVGSGSATLADFLEELCHPERAAGDEPAPQVVLLSDGEPGPALRRVLARRFARRAVLLAGSPLAAKDLRRAKAASAEMALVLADLAASDPAAEDEETVLAAAALHRLQPDLPLRVLLIRRDSKRLAVTAGLDAESVTAAHELGPRLMALAVRCAGAGTLLSNLVRRTPPPVGSADPSSEFYGAALAAMRPAGAAAGEAAAAASVGMGGHTNEHGCVLANAPTWLREYAFGAAHALHGMLLGDQWHGSAFHDAAVAMFESHGVLLLAVQYEGRCLLNPPGEHPASLLQAGGVAFALGLTAAHVADAAGPYSQPAEAPPADWKTKFHADGKRENQQKEKAAHEKAAARAAAAMGGVRAGDGQRTLDHQLTVDYALTLEARPPPPRRPTFGALLESMGAAAPAHPAASAHPATPERGAAAAAPAARGTPGAEAPPSAAARRTARIAERRAKLLQQQGASFGVEGDFSAQETVDRLASRGGHTVIVSLDPRPAAWAQVEGVLEALRQPFIPSFVPVVVLSSSRPPRRLVARFAPSCERPLPDVLFVDASGGAAAEGGEAAALDMAGTDWELVLDQAGVDTASRLLYLAGEPPSRNEFLIDRRGVLFVTMLERYRAARAMPDVFAAVELHNPHSVWHLADTRTDWTVSRSAPGKGLQGRASRGSSDRLEMEAQMSSVRRSHRLAVRVLNSALHELSNPLSGLRRCVGGLGAAAVAGGSAVAGAAGAAVATLPRMVATRARAGGGRLQPALHGRFAAGRFLFRTDVARSVAADFFTPGVAQVLHALAHPEGSAKGGEERQPTQLWRVELEGSGLAELGQARARVGELVARCAAEGVLLLALFRQHADTEQSVPAESEGGGSVHGRARRGATLPYTVSCPHPAMQLRPNDALFVLASAAWARENVSEFEATRGLEESLKVADAALTVQARWRGFAARRRLKGGQGGSIVEEESPGSADGGRNRG